MKQFIGILPLLARPGKPRRLGIKEDHLEKLTKKQNQQLRSCMVRKFLDPNLSALIR
jgi:hypothetical protein